ncbi:MAG: 50S ribosomal protein L10, partial [Candidatus Margulisiibacteriota bacterium]
EGRFVDASMVKKIASLPTREVLIAMALAGMKSPITSFVNVLSGPIRKLVYTLDAISKKKGG